MDEYQSLVKRHENNIRSFRFYKSPRKEKNLKTSNEHKWSNGITNNFMHTQAYTALTRKTITETFLKLNQKQNSYNAGEMKLKREMGREEGGGKSQGGAGETDKRDCNEKS